MSALQPGDEFVEIYTDEVTGKRYKRYKRKVSVTCSLTKEQVSVIRSAFQLFDRDNSGSIEA